jgi:hypothetical protein
VQEHTPTCGVWGCSDTNVLCAQGLWEAVTPMCTGIVGSSDTYVHRDCGKQ